MVTYLSDGGFLDSQTETVDLEFTTVSPANNKVSLVHFTFNFKVQGDRPTSTLRFHSFLFLYYS